MIAALGEPAAGHGDLIVVVESDPALAIAVLRAGARAARERPPVDIPAALATLSRAEIEETAKRVSTFDFFDHSRTWSQTAEQFRIHARATQAAAEDLRRVLGLGPRPTLRVAALVHDIGKLVLLRGYARYEQLSTVRAAPGDRRVHERNELGVDHALAGGVLARRLGLPDSLARTIEHHHDEWALGDAALIRLADMLAHYSAGALVSSSELWCVAKAVGLSAKQ